MQIPIEPVTIASRFGNQIGSPTLSIEDKGIRLQSTQPVAVYAHSEVSNAYNEKYQSKVSADTFIILPTIHLGTEYVAVGTIDRITNPNAVMAVAYQDNTIVSKKFGYMSVMINALSPGLQITIGSQQVTLNALQTVTLSVTDITTGTRVTGNKPFAAYSGNMGGYVPCGLHPLDDYLIYDYAMVTNYS